MERIGLFALGISLSSLHRTPSPSQLRLLGEFSESVPVLLLYAMNASVLLVADVAEANERVVI